MKIHLQKDSSVDIDIDNCVNLLKSVCPDISFIKEDDREMDKHTSTYVDFDQEVARISKRAKHSAPDIFLYFTERAYRDNFYYYSEDCRYVVSLSSWAHYTTLPKENGVIFFLSQALADLICPDLNHDSGTGCLSDFLWEKPGIDLCMKTAHLCNDCRKLIDNSIDPNNAVLYTSLSRILDVLANTSRWGKNVLYALEDQGILKLNPDNFEDSVADYYRSIGAEVTQNASIKGFQTDIVIKEKTASGQLIRSAIECKFHKDKIGNTLVNDFIRRVQTMFEAGQIDRGVIVSYSGFSKDAFQTAKGSKVNLMHYKDIRQDAKFSASDVSKSNQPPKENLDKAPDVEAFPSKTNEVFVVMPFSEDLDDLFYYGIVRAIEACGCSCRRVDQVEFTGTIIQEIHSLIKSSRIIIAEVTKPNPNVYYEVGYANAHNKTVILLTSDIHSAAFDVRGFNHIIYKKIKDLEAALTQRLSALLKPVS